MCENPRSKAGVGEQRIDRVDIDERPSIAEMLRSAVETLHEASFRYSRRDGRP